MATIRKRPNGTFELRIVHRNLPKPYYSTHDSHAQAQDYAVRLKAALDAGHVPPELRAPEHRPDVRVSVMLRDYLRRAPIAQTDRPTVCWLQESIDISMRGLTVRWVDDWVRRMKVVEHLAPGTIRKKVESLARAVDWWHRDIGSEASNPLRTLPKGYSSYGTGEEHPKLGARRDEERDRRLLPGEQERIEQAILGARRPDRQRTLLQDDSEAFLGLFRLILGTGLRLREAYTLRVRHIRLDLKTIHVERSKTGRPRDVPMTPAVHDWCLQALSGPARGPESLIFPFWSGLEDDLTRASARLSHRFTSTFDYAECKDLVQHDLRHEATCRWMEMKDKEGRWLYRPEEIRRITGHKNVQQFERYLSLRGSDLAERLW